VWSHPDLLPTPEDLDDPLGFSEKTNETRVVDDAQFDAALADLLDQAAQGESGTDADDPDVDDSHEDPENPTGEASEGR
jgi:hypothetical protein